MKILHLKKMNEPTTDASKVSYFKYMLLLIDVYLINHHNVMLALNGVRKAKKLKNQTLRSYISSLQQFAKFFILFPDYDAY